MLTAIEIINPRRVAITIRCTKKGRLYQVDKILQSFLQAHGWALYKVGNTYASMVPPEGKKAPFTFSVEIPTKEQVISVAQDRHANHESWSGQIGKWTAIYIPSRIYTTTDVDPFTEHVISEPKPGGIIPASFLVGIRGVWYAEVLFGNGNLTYHESESQPIIPETDRFTSPDEVPSSALLIEGAAHTITVNAYERNSEARRQCIVRYGTSCWICGFSFGAVYGKIAEGYIHVHHLRSLSEIGAEYIVDPQRDLRPVCPNCHAVLHLRVPPYTIEEVTTFLAHPKETRND